MRQVGRPDGTIMLWYVSFPRQEAIRGFKKGFRINKSFKNLLAGYLVK
jgi:hypothetical protein